MKAAKIIGRVIATRKVSSLSGMKLLLLRKMDWDGTFLDETLVATDVVGSGNSEWVFYVEARDASIAVPSNPPVDATILGIIDGMEIDD